jgi:hypothetical protein
VVRWLLRVGLLLDAGALYWLVWTPADAHRCDATTSWIGQVFCLSPWLTWVGNVMLLVPTAVLLVLAFPNVRRRDLAVAMLLLACTIEVVQHWIPGRVPEWRDALANAMGAWIVLRAWSGRRATVSVKALRSAR